MYYIYKSVFFLVLAQFSEHHCQTAELVTMLLHREDSFKLANVCHNYFIKKIISSMLLEFFVLLF